MIKEKSKLIKNKIKDKENDEEQSKDIVGMRLKNPSPFVSKMFDLEPIIFLKEDEDNGKFSRYSRSCSSSAKKQPVLITEDEMQEMKTEEYEKVIKKYGKKEFEEFSKEKQDQIIKDESFLKPEDVIKYGSNPDNKYYYVCPRYWCLKTNRPINPNEMVDTIDKNGKTVKTHPTCGGIIPNNQTTIKNDGNYVYEFFDKTEHISQENYKKHYPGFLDSKKHPDGLCIPCCFAKWNTPGQLKRRKECAQNDENKVDEVIEDKNQSINEEEHHNQSQKQELLQQEQESLQQPILKKNIMDKDIYIKGPNKSPLDLKKWGYLQFSIQNFFQESSSLCQISNTNTNIKQNHVCLLRHGIEYNEKQSFVSCIADAKYFGEENENILNNVKNMKTQIINAINLDDYIIYQNGNNVTNFMINYDNSDNSDNNNYNDVKIEKYKNSKIYKKIYKNKNIIDYEDIYFKKLILSYENFIDYLNDDNEIIDYTYLWDIICRPNPKIFQNGINLIIMEIIEDDITNKIDIICPTNHYSTEMYNSTKQTLFIVKYNNIYEPIYACENTVKTFKVVKTFSEHNVNLQANIRSIFKKIIKPIMNNICKPLPSMPNVYKFKSPIILSKLINILNTKNYNIENQILNYQSKVIGLFVSKNKLSGYIPCYPSSMDSTIQNFIYMNDDTIYSNYNNTIAFLTMVYKDSNGVIPVNPEFKIIEDEHIVGILTESNQFIQLSEPIISENVTDTIPVLDNNNYIVNKNDKPMISSDLAISISTKNDTEREIYIKKIKLETNFYNVFRNTIRILLNDYNNIKIRKKIESALNKPYVIYSSKLHEIIEYLKELVDDTIEFQNSYDYKLIDEVSTCIVLPKDKCSLKSPVCAFTNDNHCKIIIPKKNLLDDKNDNEKIYFGKMSDELIRYNRIKPFIFKPQTYLSFSTLNYNLKENEIIINQSLLNKEYFEGLIPESKNNYVKYYTYDTTDPKISQVYDNTKIIYENEQENIINQERNNCFSKELIISSKVWRDIFPSNFKELYYEDNNNCGFYLLIDIINEILNIIKTPNEIKKILVEEYGKYLIKYSNQIIDILILEGKKIQGLKVKQDILSFQDFIYSNDYFITNLDIWIILNKYKIPSIIIATKPIILTNKKQNVITLYTNKNKNDKYVIIYQIINIQV